VPLITISIFKGYSDDFKIRIQNAVHASFVSAFKIPEGDFNQKIDEYDKNNWKIPSGKSDNYVRIEVYVFPGRTRETKKKLYGEIVANLEKIGIKREDVIMALLEIPMENWAIRGGICADEVDLGYKTNI
jgi:phenylpyruvate tautomerase PptA (4-oxalocrotonate tautomerase family)